MVNHCNRMEKGQIESDRERKERSIDQLQAQAQHDD